MIFIGQAPARDGSTNLEGSGIVQLLRVMNVSHQTFLRHERLNLIKYYPGRAPGGGDLFPHDAARRRAQDLTDEWNVSPNKTIILLGRAVQRAFLEVCPSVDYFKPCGHGYLTFYVHPHPSGISRWWNDPENIRLAEAFWKKMRGELCDSPSATRTRRAR